MTVTYSGDIATAKLGTLIKLLLRWRGSAMKLIWRDLVIYLACFYMLHLIYLYGLEPENKKLFEIVVAHFRPYREVLPLSFVLGFFVTSVTVRWWDQYQNIPWPYGIAVYVSSTLHGYDEVGRAMRRTIMRYVCLSLTMVFRVLSPRVKERFPKMSDLIGAGLLTKNELTIIEDLDAKFPGYGKNWLPIVWAGSLVNRARAEGRIKDDIAVKTLLEEMNKFRGSCGNLMIYNSICIPLVYLQVVTIAVYTYFLIALVAEQCVFKEELERLNMINMDIVPVLLILQFIIYMGWLKVAETMINPFGQDDDDFEVNYLIDRNIQMSYLIVDDMHDNHPELLKDQYWDKMPNVLPGRPAFTADDRDQQKELITDIFDVVSKSSSNAQASIFSTSVLINDVEAPKPTNTPSRVNLTLSSPDLIPRPSVIDKRFHKTISGVFEKQSSLEKEMERNRRKALLDDGNGTEGTDESTKEVPDNGGARKRGSKTRRYTRHSTIRDFNRRTFNEMMLERFGNVKRRSLVADKNDKEEETESDSDDSQDQERVRGSKSKEEVPTSQQPKQQDSNKEQK